MPNMPMSGVQRRPGVSSSWNTDSLLPCITLSFSAGNGRKSNSWSLLGASGKKQKSGAREGVYLPLSSHPPHYFAPSSAVRSGKIKDPRQKHCSAYRYVYILGLILFLTCIDSSSLFVK
jgi:hypothetical protein